MATRLFAPSMGEGIEELTVVNWIKKEGETVKEMEVIVELETDKVTTEIPSPASGTLLKILAQIDETVKVGSTLAWIGQPGEVFEEEKTKKIPPLPEAKADIPPEVPEAVTKSSNYTGHVSPLVKKMVAENNIDLNQVNGSGQDGRVTKEDVLKYLESRKEVLSTTVAKPSQVNSEPVANEKSVPLAGELIQLSSLRKQIAERMVNSQHTSPHVLTVMDADLSKVLAHRAANKAAFAAQGVNLTLTAYFCSAIVRSLKSFPMVNSSWTEDGIQLHRDINLGMATALGEQGLIVPVIKDASLLSLQGLAQKVNDLATRARAKKLL
ncbi:MAG: dihydrolipoamide acetyltransferase family protein, partial [Anaerolineaceae bacterium]|nr:dihydrolipoamide acetyltransferase family protein [Anaerolineaceae bacterium]